MMPKTWIVTAAASAWLVCTAATFAQTAPAPTLQPDDTWTYRRTTESNPNVWRQVHFEGSIVRNSGATNLIRNREVDSPNPPREILINSDWSNYRSLAGKETVVHRPRKLKYRVVGWEDIEVPAGKFKALKIEADGVWTGEIAPKVVASISTQAGEQGTTAATQTTKVTAETVTGRLYQAYWYVPEIKSVEENYDTGGVRSARFTNALESFKVAN
jgi:hypothetical protein